MEVAPPYELSNLYFEVSRKLNKGVPIAKKVQKHHLFQKWGHFISSPFIYIFCVIPSYVCLYMFVWKPARLL